ncbi:hypothetical protein ACWPKO_30485 (plasmid) [Coraliomargarita sp. W4R53]
MSARVGILDLLLAGMGPARYITKTAQTGRRITMDGNHADTSSNEDASLSKDTEVTKKSGGLGADGTIPAGADGVAAGHTGEPSTFEPEEDEQA